MSNWKEKQPALSPACSGWTNRSLSPCLQMLRMCNIYIVLVWENHTKPVNHSCLDRAHVVGWRRKLLSGEVERFVPFWSPWEPSPWTCRAAWTWPSLCWPWQLWCGDPEAPGTNRTGRTCSPPTHLHLWKKTNHHNSTNMTDRLDIVSFQEKQPQRDFWVFIHPRPFTVSGRKAGLCLVKCSDKLSWERWHQLLATDVQHWREFFESRRSCQASFTLAKHLVLWCGWSFFFTSIVSRIVDCASLWIATNK